MGVGHSDKKMDRMAQNAIDAMNASGPRRSTGSKGKSGKGDSLSILVWIGLAIIGLLIAATN